MTEPKPKQRDNAPHIWDVNGHIVQVYDHAMLCTCMSSYTYVTDFGPLERRVAPCEHIRAVQQVSKEATE